MMTVLGGIAVAVVVAGAFAVVVVKGWEWMIRDLFKHNKH